MSRATTLAETIRCDVCGGTPDTIYRTEGSPLALCPSCRREFESHADPARRAAADEAGR